MKNRNIIFLWSLFCALNFTGQQLIASSDCVVQSFPVTMQSSSQSADLGFLTNSADQIKLDMQRKLAQSLLCTRADRGLCTSRRSFFDENEDTSHEQQQGSGYKGHLQKLCMMMLLMLVSLPSGMLLGSDNELPRITGQSSNADANHMQQRNLLFIDIRRKCPQLKPVGNRILRQRSVTHPVIQQDPPLVESIEASSSCCAFIPHNVRALPVTYGTNVGGNVLAGVVIALYSPNITTAAVAAGGVGCVGGCLEAYSTDHTHFSPNQHAWHNNFFTGYVADQVTGSCGSCFMSPVINAAAIAAPIGYTCGVGTGLAVRSCLARQSSGSRLQVTQVPTQDHMER